MNDSTSDIQDAMRHRAAVEKLWTEPLFDSVEDTLVLPDEGTVLVAESRCGYVPMRLCNRLSANARVIALDPSRAMLDQARQRVDGDLSRRVFFVPQRISSVSYADDVFSTSLCFNGIVTRRQAVEGLGELSRVTVAGGDVLLAVPMAASFSEFYDIVDEAFREHGAGAVLARMQEVRKGLLNSAILTDAATEAGLHDVRVQEFSWDVSFENGQEFLMSALVRETFFPHWIGVIRSSDREPIMRYVVDAIDAYWHERVFTAEVVAGVLTATR